MATFDINDVARRVQYTSTGQAGPYAFNFQVNAASELQVYKNDDLQTDAVNYNATIAADGTGSITFIDNSGIGGDDFTPSSGDLITIIGDQPLSRTTVFQVGQANNPNTLETEFDNVVIRQQQLKEMMDRSIQLKPSTPRTVTGSGTNGPLQFPFDATPSNNASKVIAYNSAGTGLELGPTTANLDTLAALASEISLVAGQISPTNNISTVAGNTSNINTVAGISSNVTTVAGISSDVTTAAGISSNITTVAGLSTEISALAGVSSSDLNTVASISSEVTTVAGNSANITTVAGISSDVTSVATINTDVSTVSGISANITTVAGISGNVTTVAGVSANVTTVASDISNVNTVATNIANINTVAGSISDVITVANDLNEAVAEIDTVAGSITNVDAVGNDITNVNTVATNISNVNTVAGISSNVTTVANNNANVTTVANNDTNITTVAGQISPTNNVGTVAGISSDVSTVAGISSNVSTVASNNANVTTVAGSISNVNTVATDIANVNTVAGNNTNVTTVATDISNVNSVAGNSTNINAVASNATNINAVNANSANINTVAGNTTNVNTVASNIADVNNFSDTYRISATAPTTSLDIGDLWFDTVNGVMKVYSASGWITAASAVNGTAERFKYTATASQTTFSGSDDNGNTLGYDAGFMDVYLNGLKLVSGSSNDYVATNGTSIVLNSGAAANDILEAIAYGTFELLNSDVGDLGNVNTTGLATNDLLRYDGTNFVPKSFDEITPTQSSNSGKFLTTDGTNSSWGTVNTNLVADTTPQLGGDLDLNSNNITGTGNIPAANLTGTLPAIDGSALTGIETGTAWQSSIKTSNFTATAGEGYWVDTSSNTVTITLPSSASVGDTIELVDYARNWGTNKIIIDSNGLNYQGDPDTYVVEYNTSGQGLRIVYSGATKGWIPTSDDNVTDVPVEPTYDINTLVVAGGGAGGNRHAGGGGAGGMLVTNSVTLNQGTQYTITVGGGGSGVAYNTTRGGSGVNSIISGSGITTLTAFGGGGGGIFTNPNTNITGGAGGSGGGGGSITSGGSGTSGQGNNGGSGTGQNAPDYGGAGGGGAGAAGSNGSGSGGGNGGNGLSSSITGSSVTYAGGGGGSSYSNFSARGLGGTGGGGDGSADPGVSAGAVENGSANLGGGGGGNTSTSFNSGNGGSGVVILSVPTANYSGTTTGSPTVTTSGSNTILKYTGSGSYTA